MEKLEESIYNRSQLLLGDDVMQAMSRAHVLIVGVGGVGSWCAEALVRSGVTQLTLVDADCICVTNVNRQVMATSRTVGQVKVDALRNHLLEINPYARITALRAVYNAESAADFKLDDYDYVVDAVDFHLLVNSARHDVAWCERQPPVIFLPVQARLSSSVPWAPPSR